MTDQIDFATKYAPAPELTDHIKIKDRYSLFINGEFTEPENGKYFLAEKKNPDFFENSSGVQNRNVEKSSEIVTSKNHPKFRCRKMIQNFDVEK